MCSISAATTAGLLGRAEVKESQVRDFLDAMPVFELRENQKDNETHLSPEILPKIGLAEVRPAVQTPLQTSGASHSPGCSVVWGVSSPLETVWPPSYPSSVG